jgi:hypothetical protein
MVQVAATAPAKAPNAKCSGVLQERTKQQIRLHIGRSSFSIQTTSRTCRTCHQCGSPTYFVENTDVSFIYSYNQIKLKCYASKRQGIQKRGRIELKYSTKEKVDPANWGQRSTVETKKNSTSRYCSSWSIAQCGRINKSKKKLCAGNVIVRELGHLSFLCKHGP